MYVLSRLLLAWISVLILRSSIGLNGTKRTVYIGGFFPLSPNKASVPGYALLAAAQLALDHVNKSNILPEYELKMIVKDSKCDPAYSANMFMDLMMDRRETALVLGAACSDVTEILAELSAYRNLVQVSYASRSLVLSNRVKYPTLFRTLPSESARNMARVKWIETFGWKNIALLYENTGSDLASQSNNQVIDKLKKFNCTIVLSEQTTGKQLDINMNMLVRNDARIIVGTFYERQARYIFCQAYKSGIYGPRYVWLLIGTYSHRWWAVRDKDLKCTQDEMKKAIAYSFIFNNQVFLGDDEQGNARRAISGVTREEYQNQYTAYLKAFNISKAPNITAYTYDAVWVMAAALNKSLSRVDQIKAVQPNISFQHPNITSIFKSAIQHINFKGITGEVAFFDDGDRYDGMVEILQHNEDGVEIPVGFYYPKEMKLQLIGKGNVWPDNKRPLDRTILMKQFVTIPLWLYVFVCVLSSLGIVLGLVFLAFNVKFRNKRYIKLSSPNLNNVIILGCIMVYSSVFLYGLDGRVSDGSYTLACRARFCLMSLGFTIGFGAMFSKTWRVHQIFISNVRRVKKVVRDKELFSLLGVIVIVDFFLLVVWMSLHPPKRQIIQIDGATRISKDRDYEIIMCREECRGPHSLPWLVTFYAFHSLLLVFGLFLAFETRKVSVAVLNDSKFIGISVYNVVLLCAIGVPLSHVTSSDPAAGFTLICAVILFCTTVTLSVLFIPKVVQMWKDPNGNPLQGTMITRQGAREQSTSATCDTERQTKLETEVIALKRENYQLKSKLNGHPNGVHLKRHGSYHVCQPITKKPPDIKPGQKSLLHIFARKQRSHSSPAETIAQNPITSRKDSEVSPTFVDQKSEIQEDPQKVLVVESEQLLEDSYSNYSSALEPHLMSDDAQSNRSIPSSSGQIRIDLPECADLEDVNSNKDIATNGSKDYGSTKSKSDKKQNGYGLKVYCVQTQC